MGDPEREEAYAKAHRRIAAWNGGMLKLNGLAIDDLASLMEALTALDGLIHLTLSDTQVADLTPLQTLTGLQRLYLSNTQIADLTPLQTLTGLQRLYLNNTQVADFIPLQTLTGLLILSLNNTQVADLTPLQTLTGLQILSLNNTQVADPTPLQTLTGLQTLHLDSTQVADLTPLQTLTGLQTLNLDSTQVADLTPLQALTGLQTLNLSNTQVTDLRPLHPNTGLASARLNFEGPHFSNTPATRANPALAHIAEIEDRKDRTRELFTYLDTLPPWPEPLPFDPASTDPAQDRPDPPPSDDAVSLRVVDGLLDLASSATGDPEDQLQAVTFARLSKAVTELVGKSNRYPELRSICEGLLAQTSGTLTEASLLDIHIDVAALTDLVETNAAREKAERFDVEALNAIKSVTRLGPPLTLTNQAVKDFEAANRDYANRKTPETVREGERRTTAAIEADDKVFGPGVRQVASQTKVAEDAFGRMANLQHFLTKEGILQVAMVAGGIAGTAVIGNAAINLSEAAWSFIWVNKDAIIAASYGWGEQGPIWAADLIARAHDALGLRPQKSNRKPPSDDV